MPAVLKITLSYELMETLHGELQNKRVDCVEATDPAGESALYILHSKGAVRKLAEALGVAAIPPTPRTTPKLPTSTTFRQTISPLLRLGTFRAYPHDACDMPSGGNVPTRTTVPSEEDCEDEGVSYRSQGELNPN